MVEAPGIAPARDTLVIMDSIVDHSYSPLTSPYPNFRNYITRSEYESSNLRAEFQTPSTANLKSGEQTYGKPSVRITRPRYNSGYVAYNWPERAPAVRRSRVSSRGHSRLYLAIARSSARCCPWLAVSRVRRRRPAAGSPGAARATIQAAYQPSAEPDCLGTVGAALAVRGPQSGSRTGVCRACDYAAPLCSDDLRSDVYALSAALAGRPSALS